MIGPARTTPAPPPTPSSADISPIPPATRSRGNSSRMIPNASGKMPPAAAWITRPTSISARVPAPNRHPRERPGDRRDERPDAQQAEHEHEQPLLAVHVAEPPDDRRR